MTSEQRPFQLKNCLYLGVMGAFSVGIGYILGRAMSPQPIEDKPIVSESLECTPAFQGDRSELVKNVLVRNSGHEQLFRFVLSNYNGNSCGNNDALIAPQLLEFAKQNEEGESKIGSRVQPVVECPIASTSYRVSTTTIEGRSKMAIKNSEGNYDPVHKPRLEIVYILGPAGERSIFEISPECIFPVGSSFYPLSTRLVLQVTR